MAASLMRTLLFASNCSRRCRSSLDLSIFHTSRIQPMKVHSHGYKRYVKPFLREMYRKRLAIGPEKLRRRSEWINWNYNSEMYAFGNRLGEDFNDVTLRQAFIHQSYIDEEKAKRISLGIDVDAMPLDLVNNSELVEKGSELLSRFTCVYLRNVYPFMFEECILSLHDFLVTHEMLSHIARHLGCEELILSQDFPAEDATLSKTFKAVVGALLHDQGQERAERFVRDFVITQLNGKDINELWPLVNPMGLLSAVLALNGRGPPEPRLLWKSAVNTVMSLYWVGIYSDQQLVAKSPGETVGIAEEMAAREAIKKIMKTEDNRQPVPMGQHADQIELNYSRINVTVEDLMKQYASSQTIQKSDTSSS